MAQLILNKNLIRSGKYKNDQKKYEGKMIVSGNSDTKIWELENGKGFAITRFSNEFPRIYASLRGAKLSDMWQFHNHNIYSNNKTMIKIKTKAKAPKKKHLGETHTDKNSHNYRISISGVALSKEEKLFLQTEGKKSKGFKYRAKILWGDNIVLKETLKGAPVQKFIVDDFRKSEILAQYLNEGKNYTKIKTTKIK